MFGRSFGIFITMADFTLDSNGIHILNKQFKVDYPETGHTDTVKFEDGSFWFKHRNNVICNTIDRYGIQGNFVDVGGGNGLQAKFIQTNYPQLKSCLVEPGYYGCLEASKRGVKYIYNSLFQDFDFQGFDTAYVGLFDVVEHIQDDAGFLIEVKAKLKKGTRIIITVPTYNWLWSDLDDYGSHHRRYNKKTIQELASKTGLQLTYFSYFFSYIVPLTYLLRVIPYKIRGARSKEEILKAEAEQHIPNPIINGFFSAVSSIERKILKLGSLPFGASAIFVLEV